MPFPIQEFWKLAVESRLFAPEECKRLGGSFAQIKGALETGNAFTLSEWLISQHVLTRYQAKVLLARRPGPFLYGDYKVQDRLDSGRLQGLFRAVHVPTRQPVCLFFLSGPHMQDPQAVPRLKQVLTAAAIKHPHVARLYHLVDLEAFKFAVLADLQGRSLEEHLAARGPFPAADACRLARQAALGLAELHKSGQTHGDLRPANLWLDPANNARLLYLPLSRDPLGPTSAMLLSGGQIDAARQAAADYLAPELIAPNRWPDHPGSDLYALGCTLFHLLVGKPPFSGGDVAGKLRRLAQEQPPLASQVNSQVPPAVAQVVAYLLAKDPAARYQQAAHVADALAAYIDPAAREPVAEPAGSTSQAYETWLDRQQPPPARSAVPMPPSPPPRPAVPMPPSPQIPVAAPVSAAIAAAPLAAVPMAQPAPGGFAPVATAVPMTINPLIAAPAFAQPAVAVQAAPAFTAPLASPTASDSTSAANRANVTAQRRQRQQAEQRTKVFIGSGVGLVLLIVGYLVYSGSKKGAEIAEAPPVAPAANTTSSTDNNANAETPAVNPPPTAVPVTPVESGPPEEPLVSIDSGPLWESPTSGTPLDLRYLPATQMYLALRPAEIWAHAEGRQVLASLGIEEFVRQNLLRLSGTTPDNLELVVLGFAGRGAGRPPAISLVARAIKSVEKETLKQNWNASEEIEIDGKTLIKGDGYTFHAPADGQDKLMVAVPTTDASELTAWLAASKKPPLLHQKLESLVRFSDSRRHATLLASPEFLQGEGRGAMLGTLGPLVEPVHSFLKNEVGQLPRAAMFSLHLSDWLFLELRLSGDSDQTPADLAKLYRSRVQGLRTEITKYKNSLEISPYSRPILGEYPRFFEVIDDYTRAGANSTDKQVVLRTALPTIAASNLAFGTHLAMLERNGGGSTTVAAAPAAPAGPQTLADKLKQKFTLTFDRDSLDRTMILISNDTGIPIKIEGGDLQLEGITKNQSFGLDEKDKSIQEILKIIMQKANPAGKLIYVFQKVDGQETVVVTTRAAAKKRGDAIPPELQ